MTNEDAATKEMLKEILQSYRKRVPISESDFDAVAEEVLAAAKDDPSLTHQEIGEILWKAVRKRRKVN